MPPWPLTTLLLILLVTSAYQYIRYFEDFNLYRLAIGIALTLLLKATAIYLYIQHARKHDR